MKEKDLQEINATITKVVTSVVNGKIDAMRVELGTMRTDLSVHNTNHQNDMERIMPVVEAFEDTKKSGLRVLWAATFIIAIGGAFEVIRGLFMK